MTGFRLLLLFYPRAFRKRYGREMAQAFERLRDRTRAERGRGGVALLWMRSLGDAAVSGIGERLVGSVPKDYGGETTMARLRYHLQHAMRSLRRSPGYAAAFILTLGLAIGVNSAVFSMVNGILLRPLPFSDADRILFLKQPITASGIENATFSFMEIDDYRSASTTVDEFVEFGDWEFTVLGEGDAHRAVGGLVTSNYFGVLGLRPASGRLLNEGDDARGSEPVMVITDEYWTRMFGRDPSVVGRILDLENAGGDDGFTPTRIVGVLEPGRHYSGSRQPDFYVNYAVNGHYQAAAMRDARGHRMTSVFARIAPGATVEGAQRELSGIAARMHDDYPETYDPAAGFQLEAVRWQDELTRRARPTILFLLATVAVVLLLAAANVTNLTLTRLIRREDELATRIAIGANRTDLRLQLTVENLLLGLGGGVIGILLAFASQSSLVAYASRFTIRAQEVGIDWRVLGITLLGSALVAAAMAWLPGLPIAPKIDRVASAQSKATDSRMRKQIQRGLVIGQLALSFTLLAAAGLLVRSLAKLTAVDPGFRTEQILTMESPVGPFGGAVPAQADPGWEPALDEVRSYPGVRSAAIASWTPLNAPAPTAYQINVDGSEREGDYSFLSAANSVSPAYFETLGIPLLAGRYFTSADGQEGAPVVILNASMARAHFGDIDPIGRQIGIGTGMPGVFGGGGSYEVVGVVADSRDYGMESESGHTFYRPSAQSSWGPAILVSHQGDAAGLTQHIREVIRGMDPNRAVENVQSMEALVEENVAPSRLNAILLGAFSLLALLIAALGVFSTLAFSVSQRVREFGIRMALGARREEVLASVLREGALVAVIALAVGGWGFLILRRFMTGLLYGVESVDPLSLFGAAAALGLVAVVASLIPAVRATRIQPTEALKGV